MGSFLRSKHNEKVSKEIVCVSGVSGRKEKERSQKKLKEETARGRICYLPFSLPLPAKFSSLLSAKEDLMLSMNVIV